MAPSIPRPTQTCNVHTNIHAVYKRPAGDSVRNVSLPVAVNPFVRVAMQTTETIRQRTLGLIYRKKEKRKEESCGGG